MKNNLGKISVFYDGACPICTREINYYEKLDSNRNVNWVDITKTDKEMITSGLTKSQALARFHIMAEDGRLYSGGTAFAKLWTQLPYFKYLGYLFQYPPMSWILDIVYVIFLRVRPAIQSLFQQKQNNETKCQRTQDKTTMR